MRITLREVDPGSLKPKDIICLPYPKTKTRRIGQVYKSHGELWIKWLGGEGFIVLDFLQKHLQLHSLKLYRL